MGVHGVEGSPPARNAALAGDCGPACLSCVHFCHLSRGEWASRIVRALGTLLGGDCRLLLRSHDVTGSALADFNRPYLAGNRVSAYPINSQKAGAPAAGAADQSICGVWRL